MSASNGVVVEPFYGSWRPGGKAWLIGSNSFVDLAAAGQVDISPIQQALAR